MLAAAALFALFTISPSNALPSQRRAKVCNGHAEVPSFCSCISAQCNSPWSSFVAVAIPMSLIWVLMIRMQLTGILWTV